MRGLGETVPLSRPLESGTTGHNTPASGTGAGTDAGQPKLSLPPRALSEKATREGARRHKAKVIAPLRTLRLRVPEDCEWVFPGEAKGKALQDIKRFWEDVRAKAELPAVRIHDLRHTFASLLVSGGMTLPMIGKLLGHTQVQTTQRYAHLLDDPLRAGLEQVGEMLRAKRRHMPAEAQR